MLLNNSDSKQASDKQNYLYFCKKKKDENRYLDLISGIAEQPVQPFDDEEGG